MTSKRWERLVRLRELAVRERARELSDARGRAAACDAKVLAADSALARDGGEDDAAALRITEAWREDVRNVREVARREAADARDDADARVPVLWEALSDRRAIEKARDVARAREDELRRGREQRQADADALNAFTRGGR
jgi:hypothetical protein